MRLKIDIMKTVVLFIAIHLMIAWVAERKEKKATQKLQNTEASDFTNRTAKMDKQDYVMKIQPLQLQGRIIAVDERPSRKPL
jgi:sensor histidine kinase regulating citrate/malate metabolism